MLFHDERHDARHYFLELVGRLYTLKREACRKSFIVGPIVGHSGRGAISILHGTIGVVLRREHIGLLSSIMSSIGRAINGKIGRETVQPCSISLGVDARLCHFQHVGKPCTLFFR